ncbi:hypothetical protein LJC14_04560 [Treponema sp. OttesenSCG-928-L16]|nr:hypothetical protein [Treponema sp. OttesenSCG-928-L16]
MRKSVPLRIAGLLLVYTAVFIALVMIQFTKRSAFTRRIGNMVVSGNYRSDDETSSKNGEILLSGDASVFYGGMEFLLSGDDGLFFVNSGGEREAFLPEIMDVSDDSVLFYFSGGHSVEFTTLFSGGTQELRIIAGLGDAAALELPYKPLRSSRINDGGNGRFIIVSDGVSYSFGSSLIDEDRRRLIFNAEMKTAHYQVIPEQKVFNPAEYIVSAARQKQSYEDEINGWKDLSVSLWGSSAAAGSGEDDVIAYIGESVRRGMYKASVPSVSQAFLNGPQRSFESSVYLGRMDAALRSLSSYDREKLSRLSRMINERSAAFLLESDVIEYLAVRGSGALLSDAAGIIRNIDPAAVSLDICPGLLEGWRAWELHMAGQDNPFDRLMDQACFVISQAIRGNPPSAFFVFQDDKAGTEFNIRLGNALALYGEEAGSGDWAALGRSLVLSVLGLVNSSASLPSALILTGDGGFAEAPDAASLSSARLYRILKTGEYRPRAASVNPAFPDMWAWTCASELSSVYSENILDISVSFPVGETHYIMTRGVRPFVKIQLYSMDYRTDPQFERYDSSGWAYSSSEQTLLLKMKHRSAAEHIRIYY